MASRTVHLAKVSSCCTTRRPNSKSRELLLTTRLGDTGEAAAQGQSMVGSSLADNPDFTAADEVHLHQG